MPMNPPKRNALDCIHFLIAHLHGSSKMPAGKERLLSRELPDTEALWQEAKAFVNLLMAIIRDAIRAYLAHPVYEFAPTA